MTGQEDIEATCLLLHERLKALGDKIPKIVNLPIFSFINIVLFQDLIAL